MGRVDFPCLSREYAVVAIDTELTARPLVLAPSIIANSISTESFIGFTRGVRIVAMGARSVMLYGIFRQFNVRHLYAFLGYNALSCLSGRFTLIVPPIDHVQFSFVALLTAIHLVLRYTINPTRPYLVGTWLALSLCVGLYESAYALILVVPILWWFRVRKMTWQSQFNVHLVYRTGFKTSVHIVLLSARRSFYQSDFLYSGFEISLRDLFSQTIDRLLKVYLRTFAIGWSEAIHSIRQNPSLLLAVLMLG